MAETVPTDGRRARRERSRAAVIDAVFALVGDGKIPPTVEDVAERAGVSVSSVFRNFDGLADMQRHAFDRFQERYQHLFEGTIVPDARREDRVASFVRIRAELLATAGPLMSIARHRALDYEPMAVGVARSRMRLADQTRQYFADEIHQLTPADAANLIAAIDALTSPEAFEVMSAAHARSDRQISRSWYTAIAALLAGWPTLPSQDSAFGEPMSTEETTS